MSNTTNRPNFECFTRSCFIVTMYLVAAIVCLPLVIIGAFGMVIFIAVTVVLIWLGPIIYKWHKNSADWRSTWCPPRGQPPRNPYNISASIPPAPPAPRMQRASDSTPPATTPGHPTSQYQLSLSSRLGRAYYNNHAGFSSPIIASHIQNPSPISYAPSAPFPSSYSPTRIHGHTAIPFAANVQPPAYTAVAQDDPGLPSTHNTTSATDEGPARVFQPSNDGLPSYEAAMSTRQPPAYEAPRTPRDDVPTTNCYGVISWLWRLWRRLE